MSIWTDLTGIEFALKFVDAGGIKTRALIAGAGEDVIFMHGTSGHLEAFTRNIVAHVQAGFTCHAIDALGHGYTDKPTINTKSPGMSSTSSVIWMLCTSNGRTLLANRWAAGRQQCSPLIIPSVCSPCR